MALVCPLHGIDSLPPAGNVASPLSKSGENGALRSVAHERGSGERQPAELLLAAPQIHGEKWLAK